MRSALRSDESTSVSSDRHAQDLIIRPPDPHSGARGSAGPRIPDRSLPQGEKTDESQGMNRASDQMRANGPKNAHRRCLRPVRQHPTFPASGRGGTLREQPTAAVGGPWEPGRWATSRGSLRTSSGATGTRPGNSCLWSSTSCANWPRLARPRGRRTRPRRWCMRRVPSITRHEGAGESWVEADRMSRRSSPRPCDSPRGRSARPTWTGPAAATPACAATSRPCWRPAHGRTTSPARPARRARGTTRRPGENPTPPR
jgi:hypothetical protein